MILMNWFNPGPNTTNMIFAEAGKQWKTTSTDQTQCPVSLRETGDLQCPLELEGKWTNFRQLLHTKLSNI